MFVEHMLLSRGKGLCCWLNSSLVSYVAHRVGMCTVLKANHFQAAVGDIKDRFSRYI